jgi:hypothetical protein
MAAIAVAVVPPPAAASLSASGLSPPRRIEARTIATS